MAQAFVPGLQVQKDAVLRRIRELPVPGEILVGMGEAVKADAAVARAYLAGELLVLRLPEKLGIEAFEALRGLQVAQGQEVLRGQLLCEHKGLFGLFKTTFTAPADGVIEFITERTGHIGLRLPARPIEVTAHVAGRIVAIAERKSVTVESRGAFIQGIFGVGGERRGTLRMLQAAPDEAVEERHIPEPCAGLVLIGGTMPAADAIKKAAAGGASGLVVGSVDDRALKAYLGYDLGIALTGDEDIPTTLILTEGFGKIPLAERIQRLAEELEGLDASLNGATQVRAGAMRPEIIVSRETQAAADMPREMRPVGLAVGAHVRIIRVPYFGRLATVVELPHKSERIETGAAARVLRAKLEDGSVVTVPRANVELLS